jgi:hypothetical protein
MEHAPFRAPRTPPMKCQRARVGVSSSFHLDARSLAERLERGSLDRDETRWDLFALRAHAILVIARSEDFVGWALLHQAGYDDRGCGRCACRCADAGHTC